MLATSINEGVYTHSDVARSGKSILHLSSLKISENITESQDHKVGSPEQNIRGTRRFIFYLLELIWQAFAVRSYQTGYCKPVITHRILEMLVMAHGDPLHFYCTTPIFDNQDRP